MKNKKNIMILVTVFLIPILLVFAIIFGVKNGKYQDAKKYAENYMFQKAEKLFLELNNFQDSAAQVEEMARLTKMNRNDTQRLIPGSENQPTYKANYWCVEHKIGLSISWYSDQEELYTQWGEYAAWGTDRNFVNVFFSEEIGNSKIVRYDQSTGEYIFLQCTKENDRYYDSMPMVEWYRGVLVCNAYKPIHRWRNNPESGTDALCGGWCTRKLSSDKLISNFLGVTMELDTAVPRLH